MHPLRRVHSDSRVQPAAYGIERCTGSVLRQRSACIDDGGQRNRGARRGRQVADDEDEPEDEPEADCDAAAAVRGGSEPTKEKAPTTEAGAGVFGKAALRTCVRGCV